MRGYDEAWEHSRDEPAFSNGDEGYGWMENWCDRCVHDKSARTDTPNAEGLIGCPLVLIAMCSRTPSEWLDGPRDERGLFSIADQYHCVEFRDENDPGGGEPEPIPDPPDQGLLFPRDPFVGVRMFAGLIGEEARVG